MPKCCIKGCDSSKHIGNKEPTLFSFPTHNENLLKKWLNIIDVAGWSPSALLVCSMHFATEDMQYRPNGTGPTLKPTSVPTIFPTHEAKAKVVDQPCYDGILMTLPLEQPPPTVNPVAIKNSNFPIAQSSPLILVPTQYILQCQGQFPFLVPTQLLSQIKSPPMLQNTQANVQNPGAFGQFSSPTSDQKSLGLCQPSQTVVKNLEKSGELSQAQDPIKISPVSPMNAHNPVKTLRSLQPNDQKPILTPPISQANGQNPAQPAHFVQHAGVRNSHETSAPPQVNAADATTPRTLLQSNDQNPIQTSRVSQANGQHPAQPVQFVQLARVQNSTTMSELSQSNAHKPARPCKLSQSNDRNQETPQGTQGTCRNSAQPTESSFEKSVVTRHTNANETKGAQGMPDAPADRSTTLCPPLRKILPTPETSLASKTEFPTRAAPSDVLSKPDILIVPMCRNSSKKKGSELSFPLRYPGNKRPTLRITINKRYNVPLEPKISAVTAEKDNPSTGADSADKRITIENASANKSVTFRLDHKTGEIHLENSEVAEASRTSQHSGRRRINRKSRSSIVRKTSPTMRKRSARTRRIVKETEIPGMSLSTRASESARVARASDPAR